MKSIAIGVHLRREDVEPIVEATAAGDLVISGLPVPDDQSLSERELLVRIASLRAALLDRATFVAIRYGFTFRNGAEVESKCAASLARWRTLLEEHAGRVEFTLKIAAGARVRPDRRSFSSGADYLRALQHARDSVDVPAEFRAAVERELVPLTVKHRWVNRDATSLELAGLMTRDVLPRLAEAGEAIKREAPGVPFLLSAPWPLEVFAE